MYDAEDTYILSRDEFVSACAALSLVQLEHAEHVEPYYSRVRKACFNLVTVPGNDAFLTEYRQAWALWRATARGFSAGEQSGLDLAKLREQHNR